jgi:CRISPR-associated protein (TIGR03984 family)
MPEVNDRREFPATWTNEEFQEWLRGQMNGERKWLLAHADDGVIWGRWENGAIITSTDVARDVSPELRLVTLQQAFIFGERDEVKLWRDEDGEATGWRARRLSDGEDADVMDEPQLLWGSEIVEWHDDFDGKRFTHVRERKSNYGMDHVVPIEVTKDDLDNRRLKLLVRHFITYDEQTGEARITLSRLVSIESEQPPQQ